MKLQLYKMNMQQSHFGAGSLATVEATPSAERIFSALFIEALKIHQEDEFLDLARSSDFVMSNGLPYLYGLYLPKPIGYPKKDFAITRDSRDKAKASKKLEFIHIDIFDEYINGELEDVRDLLAEEEELYIEENITKNAVKAHTDTELYRMSIVRYKEDVEVAFIATKDPLLEDLMARLQYSGIGGKRSVGYGLFDFSTEALYPEVEKRIVLDSDKDLLLLTDSFPKDEDLDKSLEGADYLIEKSSGFAFSTAVEAEDRKADLFKFKAGSCFRHSFKGDIYNLAPASYPHPVWNYAKPLFYELEVEDE